MPRPCRSLRLVALFSLLAGCASARPSAQQTTAPAPATAQNPPATADRAPPSVAQEVGGLPWWQDRYDKALAESRAKQIPLVIDFWAEWCHTCLSMKHTVLADPGLRSLADRFVWLAVDTEQTENAAVVEQFPPLAWPSFFVVDPEREQSIARLSGGCSVRQFREFLLDAELAYQASQSLSGRLAQSHPLARLRHADALARDGQHQRAITIYDRILNVTPKTWPRRVDVLVLRLRSTVQRQAWSECAAWLPRHLPQAGETSTATEFMHWASRCTAELEATASQTQQLTAEVIEHIRELYSMDTAPLSADDRSELLRVLRNVHEQRGETSLARRAAEQQLNLLARAAQVAPTPYAASTYNWPRSEVHHYLGRGRELLPALRQSVKALPNHYDPPYRLAWMLQRLGQTKEALPWAQRALSLVEGPRRQRIERLIAEIKAELSPPTSR